MAQRPEGPATEPRRLPRVVIAVLLLMAIAAAVLGTRWWNENHDRGVVRASGMIEMDETDVASLVGGRIVRLTVQEGDTVRTGDTLAVLDQGTVTAALLQQQAELGRAAAQSQEVTAGPRAQEIALARANLDAATAQRVLAEREADRSRKLFDAHVISQADLDRVTSDRDAASAKERAARESLRLLELGRRREEIAAAKAATASMHAAVEAARSRNAELVLTSPMDGVVLLKNFTLGELVQANQPVVTLGDPEKLWIRVYVAAPRITEVKLGAPVEVRLGKGAKSTYHGRVIEVASQAEFTPRAALTEEERADLVFGVKIRLDPTRGVLKAGLPADAYIGAARPTP